MGLLHKLPHLIHSEKRTPFADTLIILIGMVADDFRLLHLHSEMLLHKIDGAQNSSFLRK